MGSYFVHARVELFCLGMMPRAQLFKKSTNVLQLIGDRTPPTARNRSESTQTRNCNLHTRSSEPSWCLNNSVSSSVGLSILDHAMGFAYRTGLASMQSKLIVRQQTHVVLTSYVMTMVQGGK